MDGITSFDVKSLRKVKTNVRTADGRQFVEARDSKGEPRIVSTPRFDGSMGFVPDLKPDLQVGEVIPGLHIGSQDAAADWCLLQSLAVTHVVNAVATTVPNFHEDRGLAYLALELLDLPDFTLTRDTIDKVCDFIDEALSIWWICACALQRRRVQVVRPRAGLPDTAPWNGSSRGPREGAHREARRSPQRRLPQAAKRAAGKRADFVSATVVLICPRSYEEDREKATRVRVVHEGRT
ncbi:hypothetical protein MTO96_000145 [Rhipicephalus appendiculatus]